ncbi:tyrosine-protein kinase [Streptococcus tangpeifui]|uniref:tyrosine-protein kinase n=1 Tax=Streptococcus tangpeifui TaxID=2709400 RepID=UPI0013EAF1FB|nr:tyrosine-protein kinase [Streptococcus sp. ZJ1593]
MGYLELSSKQEKTIDKAEEYYNSIRANIQFSGSDIKVIALTSVQPKEGKSTTTMSLAVSFARAGYRTLLIDADTRNSVMMGSFKPDGPVKGLTDFLSGNADLQTTISRTNIPSLTMIPAGQVPPNPTALFQSDNFKRMIEAVREHYDYVLLDTPPIGKVVDAAIIAQDCDASVLITEAGVIRSRFVKKAIEQMEKSGAQFLGVILNKVDEKSENYGNYGSYGSYGDYGKRTAATRTNHASHTRRAK